MNYESYKQFFDGGFFPIDSNHKIVNLANTGEFEVTATTGSDADTKTTKHYLPYNTGLTNMLRNYTGGSKFEALTQSQRHTFIPELADCTSYSGAEKAIVNHFEQTKKPLIIDLDYSYSESKSISITFETSTNRIIEWGDGETYRGTDITVNHQYNTAEKFRVKIYNWIDGQIKIQQTGEILNYFYPIYATTYSINDTFIISNCALEGGSYEEIYFNTNSAINQTGVSKVVFGTPDNIINMNTGLSEWINLEEMKDSVGEFYLYCKNLHFDGKNLTFGLGLDLYIYPDEVTAKTTIEYFATKATGTFSAHIIDAPGAQSIYNWAQQYADKFYRIDIETI